MLTSKAMEVPQVMSLYVVQVLLEASVQVVEVEAVPLFSLSSTPPPMDAD